MNNNKSTIIFDGICNFCNSSVNFIIARDPEGKFSFAPMQGETAQALMKQHGIDNPNLDTFLLIKDGKLYQRTDAALEITKDLTGFWKLFRVFVIVPAPIRDVFYRVFAKYRYRLFGKKDVCMVPTPEVRERFLG
ncbi:thiol-disulfide oxidoreductase DCC family protein [Leucothrix pacifica]|uniref:Thiol-disulfide oxidoreductase n=1 Tax=Leucothrix pacifica TaxID=1247513 RepID=A0A317CAH6_9GAMM|nr:thiol-disulfide oxidoreductase DCC family protein [Leucothrix pacifica]PWQ95379.1 thiol-disulfide oxidoreductase [Leucothrix pacifica]